MTEKVTCGRLSTCELCSRCLLAEMLFQGRTWLPHPSMLWVGGLTTLCDRVQSSREGARARVSHKAGSGAWLACNTSRQPSADKLLADAVVGRETESRDGAQRARAAERAVTRIHTQRSG